MKISRFLIIFFVAATTMLVSCEEFEDTVEPSPTVSDDNPAVRFAAENSAVFEIPSTVTAIDLTVIRSGKGSAIEVPVTVIENTENAFDVPATLSFPAGEDTVTFTLPITDNAPVGVDLSIAVKFGDEFVNPYKSEYGEYYGTVTILNWQPFANGTYQSAIFDGASWEQVLHKAENTNRYRFFDLYAVGTHFNFKWDGGEAIIPEYGTDADGYYIYMPGVIHPTYGEMTVLVDGSTTYTFYDAEGDFFQIEGNWTVAAGSFGWLDDYYFITERY